MGLTALMKLSFLGWRAWCIAYGKDKAYARAISSYTLSQFHAGTWACIKRSCLRFFSYSFGENVQCGLSSKACAHLCQPGPLTSREEVVALAGSPSTTGSLWFMYSLQEI